MLKAAGWKDGDGLGAAGQGIVAPVNLNASTTGVGVGKLLLSLLSSSLLSPFSSCKATISPLLSLE
jgi:hypothetical protein